MLVVEDEDAIRGNAVDALRDADFDVIEASNGADAFALISAGAMIDVLFTDVRMPGTIDGVELARRARALRPGLTIIVTSGGGGRGHPLDRLAGDARFLPKPYALTALAELAMGALGARRSDTPAAS